MEKISSNPTKEEHYSLRKAHWSEKEATLNAVLGGWGDTHLPDIKCSNELLTGLICTKNLTPKRAIDCAAGIGRVTQFVLVNFFEEVDIIEQDEKFVKKAKETLSSNPKVKNYFCQPIETFNFNDKKNYYDLIWIQWCLENIEDEDLDSFLKKCYEALTDDGIIIVKENIYLEENEEENYVYDKKNVYSKEDLSKQRDDLAYINLFVNNGFEIFRHFPNPNWPEGLMPMVVYVLKKDKDKK